MENPLGFVGHTIGKYRIVEQLGRGGMAEVYKAFQPSLDRYVALKLMHAFLASDPDFIARFEREAKNVAALRHPNIIQVYDFDVHNGTPFMVMEFIEGGTLKTYLENLAHEGRSLPLSEAIHIIHEVGEALAFAHQRNMIHRDVKPANVMLDFGGRVILTDFGIAKILTGPAYTMTGATIGTPAYMSPEQGLGKPGDHRSDIYALGVMLYQLATGQLPFEADTPLAVMLKHVNEPLPLPHTVRPDLPEGIERIILKAMAKNPDDRFQSAEEMLAQLHDLESAESLPIPPASMAAGAQAHAPTVAAVPAGATIAARPGPAAAGATRLAQPGRAPRGGAESQATIAAQPPAEPLPTPRRAPTMLFAAVGILALLVVLGGGAFAFTGGFGLLRRATPSQAATAEVAAAGTPTLQPTLASPGVPAASATATEFVTPTPDRVGTQLAALELTQNAIAAAVATATPTTGPDQTATLAACVYDYAMKSQDPADGKTLVLGTKITKVVTLQNTGNCTLPAGTVLSETITAGSVGILAAVPEIPPGQKGEVLFEWASLNRPGTASHVLEVRLPDGRVIGQPLSFTFEYVAAATRVPPTAALPTAVPPTGAPTPSTRAGLSDIWAVPQSCAYQGDLDYRCTMQVFWSGGVGPFTLWVEGQRIGAFSPSDYMTFQLVWRRCNLATFSMIVRDDGTNTEIAKGGSFDPAGNGSLFPGGLCTLP